MDNENSMWRSIELEGYRVRVRKRGLTWEVRVAPANAPNLEQVEELVFNVTGSLEDVTRSVIALIRPRRRDLSRTGPFDA